MKKKCQNVSNIKINMIDKEYELLNVNEKSDAKEMMYYNDENKSHKENLGNLDVNQEVASKIKKNPFVIFDVRGSTNARDTYNKEAVKYDDEAVKYNMNESWNNDKPKKTNTQQKPLKTEKMHQESNSCDFNERRSFVKKDENKPKKLSTESQQRGKRNEPQKTNPHNKIMTDPQDELLQKFMRRNIESPLENRKNCYVNDIKDFVTTKNSASNKSLIQSLLLNENKTDNKAKQKLDLGVVINFEDKRKLVEDSMQHTGPLSGTKKKLDLGVAINFEDKRKLVEKTMQHTSPRTKTKEKLDLGVSVDFTNKRKLVEDSLQHKAETMVFKNASDKVNNTVQSKQPLVSQKPHDTLMHKQEPLKKATQTKKKGIFKINLASSNKAANDNNKDNKTSVQNYTLPESNGTCYVEHELQDDKHNEKMAMSKTITHKDKERTNGVSTSLEHDQAESKRAVNTCDDDVLNNKISKHLEQKQCRPKTTTGSYTEQKQVYDTHNMLEDSSDQIDSTQTYDAIQKRKAKSDSAKDKQGSTAYNMNTCNITTNDQAENSTHNNLRESKHSESSKLSHFEDDLNMELHKLHVQKRKAGDNDYLDKEVSYKDDQQSICITNKQRLLVNCNEKTCAIQCGCSKNDVSETSHSIVVNGFNCSTNNNSNKTAVYQPNIKYVTQGIMHNPFKTTHNATNACYKSPCKQQYESNITFEQEQNKVQSRNCTNSYINRISETKDYSSPIRIDKQSETKKSFTNMISINIDATSLISEENDSLYKNYMNTSDASSHCERSIHFTSGCKIHANEESDDTDKENGLNLKHSKSKECSRKTELQSQRESSDGNLKTQQAHSREQNLLKNTKDLSMIVDSNASVINKHKINRSNSKPFHDHYTVVNDLSQMYVYNSDQFSRDYAIKDENYYIPRKSDVSDISFSFDDINNDSSFVVFDSENEKTRNLPVFKYNFTEKYKLTGKNKSSHCKIGTSENQGIPKESIEAIPKESIEGTSKDISKNVTKQSFVAHHYADASFQTQSLLQFADKAESPHQKILKDDSEQRSSGIEFSKQYACAGDSTKCDTGRNEYFMRNGAQTSFMQNDAQALRNANDGSEWLKKELEVNVLCNEELFNETCATIQIEDAMNLETRTAHEKKAACEKKTAYELTDDLQNTCYDTAKESTKTGNNHETLQNHIKSHSNIKDCEDTKEGHSTKDSSTLYQCIRDSVALDQAKHSTVCASMFHSQLSNSDLTNPNRLSYKNLNFYSPGKILDEKPSTILAHFIPIFNAKEESIFVFKIFTSKKFWFIFKSFTEIQKIVKFEDTKNPKKITSRNSKIESKINFYVQNFDTNHFLLSNIIKEYEILSEFLCTKIKKDFLWLKVKIIGNFLLCYKNSKIVKKIILGGIITKKEINGFEIENEVFYCGSEEERNAWVEIL